MASSSSSAAPAGSAHQDDIAPLPLIRCPRCNRGVTVWFISGTAKNPGRHFYKCEYHGVCIFIDIDPSASFIRLHKHDFFSSIFFLSNASWYQTCNFWRWEDKYIEYIIARWGHIFSPAPPHAGFDELKATLIQNQSDIKNIKWMLMGWMVVVVALLAAKY
jgi:hypothetical protein